MISKDNGGELYVVHGATDSLERDWHLAIRLMNGDAAESCLRLMTSFHR